MPPPRYLIVIQADDLGIDDLGIAGNPLAYTPNIDRLARASVNVMDFTVNPVCAPSRATLLTGRHFLRTGIAHVHGGKDYLHRDERTIADAMRTSGWRTGMWGKWHLGRGPGYEPWQRGFDEAYAAELYKHEKTTGEFNGKPIRHARWSDDAIVDYTLDFLDRANGRPSFLYLPSMTPHGPLKAPQRWVEFHRKRGLPAGLATLFAMVSSLDEAIGRLVAGLEARDALQNTLLVFTSDNGPDINRGILTDEERRLRKTSARRGWKGDIWENGVRAPLFIHWPARLKPGVSSTPMDQVDLLPTLLDWSGVPWPQSHPPLDGTSRRALVETAGSTASSENPEPIFNYAHPGWLTSKRAYDPIGLPGEYNPVPPETKSLLDGLQQVISIRQGRYKLLLNPFPTEENRGPEWVLFDLSEDPGETSNLVTKEPEVFARLREQLLQWFDKMRDEPHAFTAPVFEIVPDRTAEVWGRMPTRLSGPLQNSITGLRGWIEAGTSATYRLDVKSGGMFLPSVHWQGDLPKGFLFSLRAGGGRSVSGTSDGSSTVQFPPLPIESGTEELVLSLEAVGDRPPSHELHLIALSPALLGWVVKSSGE